MYLRSSNLDASIIKLKGLGFNQYFQYGCSDRVDFWAWPVEILVFASPTGYMLTSSGFPFLNWVYYINSSKMIGAILNSNWLFLKLNCFIYNYLSVLPDHSMVVMNYVLYCCPCFRVEKQKLQKKIKNQTHTHTHCSCIAWSRTQDTYIWWRWQCWEPLLAQGFYLKFICF